MAPDPIEITLTPQIDTPDGGSRPFSTTDLSPASVSKGYEQITGNGVQSLTVPAGAVHALIQPEGSLRLRDDGDPSATVGFPVGDEGFRYDGDRLASLRLYVISGVVNVWYYA